MSALGHVVNICLVLNDTFALGQKPSWQEEPSVSVTALQW